MAVGDVSCKKDLISWQRIPQIRELITEEKIRDFKLRGDRRKGETKIVGGTQFLFELV